MCVNISFHIYSRWTLVTKSDTFRLFVQLPTHVRQAGGGHEALDVLRPEDEWNIMGWWRMMKILKVNVGARESDSEVAPVE